ncbi:hypothetical protein [Sphingomonas japonica]|uniref:Uncharacterized protein n=1 Tax=Sphingomonas japonica TaxID=511662 RepID=A0ABX0U2J3_9SPHN|nr:hypothetical protein [Sphingomonas japonica]NIJ23587.1 hypothetical protein [Sphingomonas japonica]
MSKLLASPGRILPRRLGAVPRRMQPLADMLWWLLLALVVLSAIGGSWHGWTQAQAISPAFYQLGLSFSDDYEGSVSVDALTPQVRRSGPIWPAHIVAIDGKPAPAGMAALARALSGPPGSVRLTVDDDVSPPQTLTLRRGPDVQRAAMGTTSPVTLFLLETGLPLAATLAMMACAALIFRKRRRDPVALMLSFALLCGASTLIGTGWWLARDLEIIDRGTGLSFFALLIIVVTAFPDGAFRSRWAAGVAVAAGPLALALMAFPSESGLAEGVIVLLLLAVILLPWRRFRRTPPGIERQQLKWAAVGFCGAAIVLLVAAMVIVAVAADAFPASWELGANLATGGLLNFSLVVLAVGTTVAVLRISLWDADAAIGKSAGVGAVTVALGGIWAGCTILANETAAALFGAENKALAAAASAIIAGSVVGPARARISKWIDDRINGEVAAIAALPEQISLWRQGDTPADIGRRVTDTIAAQLGASRAALLVWTGDRFTTAACRGVEASALATWLAERVDDEGDVNETAPGDPLFPIRLRLRDGTVPVGLLLIGGRPQGAGLAKDVRAALNAVRTPVAAALRDAYRHDRREAALSDRLRALDRRLAQLETGAQSRRTTPLQA